MIFEYSKGSVRKSVFQEERRNKNYANFAKMLRVFEHLVERAQPIEAHTDKYVDTKRHNPNLERVYVLSAGFKDGNMVIPVEFNIKQFREGTKNTLYISVTLKEIEADLMAAPSEQDSYRTAKSTSIYSLPDLIKKINPSNGDFLRYIPDESWAQNKLKASAHRFKRKKLV